MTEFRVLKTFKDIHTGDIYSPNQVIKISLKRAKEVTANLGSGFIVRINEELAGWAGRGSHAANADETRVGSFKDIARYSRDRLEGTSGCRVFGYSAVEVL